MQCIYMLVNARIQWFQPPKCEKLVVFHQFSHRAFCVLVSLQNSILWPNLKNRSQRLKVNVNFNNFWHTNFKAKVWCNGNQTLHVSYGENLWSNISKTKDTTDLYIDMKTNLWKVMNGLHVVVQYKDASLK